MSLIAILLTLTMLLKPLSLWKQCLFEKKMKMKNLYILVSFFQWTGSRQSSVDSLAFETMTPKTIIQRYVSLLLEHRRIILCGNTGTGKTYLAQKLAEHVVLRCVIIIGNEWYISEIIE